MQVSRTLRCLQITRPLRTFQLVRSVDDVARHSAQTCLSQPCQQQVIAPMVNQLKRVQYSTSNDFENETQQSTEDANKDGIDVHALFGDTKNVQRKLTDAFYTMQTMIESNILRAKTRAKFWNKIEPWISDAVDFTQRPGATSDDRRKCLFILLHCNGSDHLLSQVLKATVSNSSFMAVEDIVDIVHIISVSKTQNDIARRARHDLVTDTVNKRWFEIGSRHILFFLYQLDELFNMKEICMIRRQKQQQHDQTTAQSASSTNLPEEVTPSEIDTTSIENRLISLVDDLKPRDMARVVTLMGRWRNRNQILLQALVHRLSLSDMSDFSLFHLSNLLFACSVLSIYNAELLNKLATELTTREISSSASVSSVLLSFSHLRWHDADTISKCMSSMSTVYNNGTPGKGRIDWRESLNFLMSLANLYAIPSSDDEKFVMKSLADRLLSSDSISALQKVDVAWCLAILRMLDEQVAKNLLDSSFIQQFTDGEAYQNRIALQKLRGINLAANFELDGYEGPYMEEALLNVDSEKERNAAQVILSGSLSNALSKFVDMKTYVMESQSLPGGLHADAVMCSDSKGNLMPLAKLENSDSGLHRVAIQTIPFNGTVSSHKEPTTTCGVHCMAARHLLHLGYTPVQIPYSDLRKSQSVLEHVNSIQSRIKKAVCGDGINDNNSTISTDGSNTGASSSEM